MILEPVFYTPCVEIMFHVARQANYLLLGLKFSEADATLVLIC